MYLEALHRWGFPTAEGQIQTVTVEEVAELGCHKARAFQVTQEFCQVAGLAAVPRR